MKIWVINGGVQPETIHAAFSLYERNLLGRYYTNSSVGIDYKPFKFLFSHFPKSEIARIAKRRVMAIPEDLIVRRGFAIEVLGRFLPPMVGNLLRSFNDNWLKSLVAKDLRRTPPLRILCQTSIGERIRQSSNKMGIQVYLTVSIASPQYQNKMLESEANNYIWFKYYFPKKSFTIRQISEFTKDVRCAYTVLVPSLYVQKSISEFLSNVRVEVAHLGADPKDLGHSQAARVSNRTHSSLAPLRVIFVGQAQQRKGIGYLIEAFALASLPAGSSVTFVGRSVNGSHNFISQNFQFAKIIGHVSRSELGQLLDAHDVFVLPSLVEGFALSAIEAMSTGIPVILTDQVLNGVVLNHVNGLIVESQSAKSLAGALDWASSHRGELAELGKQGAKTAESFTWKVYERRIIQILGSGVET
jgi:glycosyltransferase involved in cell wall biosynthesis